MKNLILLLFSLLGVSAFAQLDSPNTVTGGNTLSTPNQLNSTTRSAPSLSKKNNNFYRRPQTARLEQKEEKIDITENEGFIDPEIDFDPKYLKQEPEKEMSDKFKQNQYLGDFKTKSGQIKIICRDHQAVDGDMVRVYKDGEVVVDKIYLEGQYKTVYLELKEGFNKIEIEALNQGQSGPNTAEFKVLDESGRIINSNIWNLATGYKASFIVVKTE
ncbi:hypothetical protein [Mesonia mobilis]|uniref:Secreted protein n=1 Tax=Mesonia mobilis TaxID=369791 RepID=A0ABQ3BKV4_9FLAO|nr:hypothetical protein [Mesonia mobilis]MBQ0738719.1 hypothetical protein [Aquimarina celericrescens]GGZ49748.1 hypothetical protein GCM10008088_09000 [Mesonia mobilis]